MDEVLAAARAAGVARILAVGTEPESSARCVELARRFPEVYAAVGIHPSEAGRFDGASRAAALRSTSHLATEPKVVAIGEIGLDYHWTRDSIQEQRELFAAQLALAAGLGLPVVIHNRDADADVVAALRSEARPSVLAGRAGVLHCFGGNLSLAEEGIQLGFYVSFAGNLTYKRADDLRAVAARVPPERLLVETDSPYLAPIPLRGQENVPANVRLTLETLARVRGRSVDEVAEATFRNAGHLFRWDDRG
jgi:TatD DNase family protein